MSARHILIRDIKREIASLVTQNRPNRIAFLKSRLTKLVNRGKATKNKKRYKHKSIIFIRT